MRVCKVRVHVGLNGTSAFLNPWGFNSVGKFHTDCVPGSEREREREQAPQNSFSDW